MDNFAKDVYAGLSSNPKFLLPKYFYDEVGSQLFRHITSVKEYYPTNCEFEILSLSKARLLELINQYHKKFMLIELGAGEGKKTKVLINHFISHSANFSYVPIDICPEENEILKNCLESKYPDLKVSPVNAEFLEGLEELGKPRDTGKVILFLGSTIGNLPSSEIKTFLKELNKRMSKDDLMLTGFDLKKHPKVIAKAYDDEEGFTRQFNLNLLARINKELEGNFDISQFEHYPSYDPLSGEARSYLVSSKNQKVLIKKLKKEFTFNEGEIIHTEISRKFSFEEIEELCFESGFRLVENFSDTRNYFVDSLWAVEPKRSGKKSKRLL